MSSRRRKLAHAEGHVCVSAAKESLQVVTIGQVKFCVPASVVETLDKWATVEWSAAETSGSHEDGVVTFRGTVMSTHKEHSLISCGGYLVQIPESAVVGTTYTVCVSSRAGQ